MAPTLAAPIDWVKAVGDLKLPARTDRRLQELMHRNNDGDLNEQERAELEALVDLSQELSLVRATALRLLERKPA